MASQYRQYLIKKAVEETFDEIKKYSPDVYKKIESDPYLKEITTEEANKSAAEEVDFDRDVLQNPAEEVVGLLTDSLPVERIQLVQEAFSIPTFDMEIIQFKRRKDGNLLARVEFTMQGEEFLPPMELVTRDDINWAKILQYASIAIEAVMFSMQAAGIAIDVRKGNMQDAVHDIAKVIKESSAMENDLKSFVKSWKRAGSNNWAKAKAIFSFLRDSNAVGLLWAIVKSLCKDKSWWDWIKIAVKVRALPKELARDKIVIFVCLILIISRFPQWERMGNKKL